MFSFFLSECRVCWLLLLPISATSPFCAWSYTSRNAVSRKSKTSDRPPGTRIWKVYVDWVFLLPTGSHLKMICVNSPHLCTFELGNADLCVRRWHQVHPSCCLEQLLLRTLINLRASPKTPAFRKLNLNYAHRRSVGSVRSLCPPSHTIRRYKGD